MQLRRSSVEPSPSPSRSEAASSKGSDSLGATLSGGDAGTPTAAATSVELGEVGPAPVAASLPRLEEVMRLASKANRFRAMPWLVVVAGTAMATFWMVMSMVPDGRAWPSVEEVITGTVSGGVLIAVGGVLALLSDVLPARNLVKAAQELSDNDRLHAAERNRLVQEMKAKQERGA